MFEPIMYRGTGRTTRALEEALRVNNSHVIFVARTRQMAEHAMMNNLQEILERYKKIPTKIHKAKMIAEFLGDKVIIFMGMEDFMFQRGMRTGCTVIFDHTCCDQSYKL